MKHLLVFCLAVVAGMASCTHTQKEAKETQKTAIVSKNDRIAEDRCTTSEAVTEKDATVREETANAAQSRKVIAGFLANAVWETEPNVQSAAAASVSVAYLLLDNGEVIIIKPQVPKVGYAYENRLVLPFSKNEAKIILMSQKGLEPEICFY